MLKEQMYIQAIETLNTECINLRASKEFTLGRKMNKVLSLVRRADIASLWELLRASRVRRSANRSLAAEVAFVVGDSNAASESVLESPRYIYSCITDGYDVLSRPLLVDDTIRYILYSDTDAHSEPWETIDIGLLSESDTRGNANRYCKTHPHVLFGKHGFALYVDGNVQIVSDVNSMFESARRSVAGIAMHRHPSRHCLYAEAEECLRQHKGQPGGIKSQVAAYAKEGMPHDYGLLEATVIAVDLSNEVAMTILEEWWAEFVKWGSGRDQLALPYVLWRHGIGIASIGNLGSNVKQNPKLRVNPRHGGAL